MIAPFWTRFRVGPYLRREADKRNYQLLFSHDGYISGLHRMVLLASFKKIAEMEVSESDKSQEPESGVVLFRGMGGWFQPFKTRYRELRAELMRITRPAHIDCQIGQQTFIGVHIRRGDFAIPTDSTVFLAVHRKYRLPLEWYIAAIAEIRHTLGDLPALVFSDGSVDELSPILDQPNVRLFRGGSAITDLFALSTSCVLVPSCSTFSMWASFLGQVPCVWYPGQRVEYLVNSGKQPELEPEFDIGKRLPDLFLKTVNERCAARVNSPSTR